MSVVPSVTIRVYRHGVFLLLRCGRTSVHMRKHTTCSGSRSYPSMQVVNLRVGAMALVSMKGDDQVRSVLCEESLTLPLSDAFML